MDVNRIIYSTVALISFLSDLLCFSFLPEVKEIISVFLLMTNLFFQCNDCEKDKISQQKGPVNR